MNTTVREPREITIELGQKLAPFAAPDSTSGSGLIDYLTPVISDLIADLDIPAEYVPVVKEIPDAGDVLRVRVEDRQCRIPVDTERSVTAGEHSLAGGIAGVLYTNLALLFPPDQSQPLWKEFTGSTASAPVGFTALIHDLLGRGVSIRRLRPFVQELHSSTPEPSRMASVFEQVMADVKGQRLRVFVSKPHHKRLYDEDGNAVKIEGDYDSIVNMIEMMGDGLFYELGVPYRLDGIEPDDSLEEHQLRVQVNDLRSPPQEGIRPNEFLVNDTVDRLTLLGVDGRIAVNPANGVECAIVADVDGARELCEKAGLVTWDDHGYMILYASSIIRRSMGALLNCRVAEFLMERLRLAFPELVEQALEKYDDTILTQVLRCLTDEEISIRDLRSILESLLSYQGAVSVDSSRYIVFQVSPGAVLLQSGSDSNSAHGPADFAEYVRGMLKRNISHKYTRGGNTLVVYLMDPGAEARLRQRKGLTDAEHLELTKALRDEVGNLPPTAQSPVILTTVDVRRRLRNEIHQEFPHLAVLSYQELSPDMNIQPIARISPDLKAYDEGFIEFIGALPLVISRPPPKVTADRKPALPGKDPLLLTFLETHAARIVNLVAGRIVRNHPIIRYDPGLEEALQILLERIFDGYLELAATGQTGALDTLFDALLLVLPAKRIRFSEIFGILLKMAEVIRSLFAEEYSGLDHQEAIQKFNQALELTDATARRAACRFLEISKFVRRIQ